MDPQRDLSTSIELNDSQMDILDAAIECQRQIVNGLSVTINVFLVKSARNISHCKKHLKIT